MTENEINLGRRKVSRTGSSLTITLPETVVQNAKVVKGDMADATFDGKRKLTYTFKEK